MFIKSYNSTDFPSDYVLGDIYTFYLHNTNSNRLSIASEEMVKEYSSKLTKINEDDSFTYNDGKYLTFTRVIGIIVDKHKSIGNKDMDMITVMFKTDDNRYVLNKYLLNSHDVFTNNKDFITPSAVLRTA